MMKRSLNSALVDLGVSMETSQYRTNKLKAFKTFLKMILLVLKLPMDMVVVSRRNNKSRRKFLYNKKAVSTRNLKIQVTKAHNNQNIINTL